MSTLSAKNIARALGGDARGADHVVAPGPGHTPQDRSLSIKLDPNAPDGFVVHSFAGNDPIVCRDYVREKAGLGAFKPNGQQHPRVIAEYVYQQADGTPYLRVQRTDTKQFWQSHWNGESWIWGKPKGRPKIPYRLPDIAKHQHATIFVVEGEKDADRLAGLGLVATTASEGAGKWAAYLNQYFRGRDVCVLPDNDDQGVAHAQDIITNLLGVAAKVRVVQLAGLPPKGDVSDWLDQGGTADKLQKLCLDTPEFEGPIGAASAPAAVTRWPIMDTAAYHGLAGDVVNTIAPHSEADPVALLIQFLTLAGNVIGREPYYQVESDRHHVNLFGVLVGASAKARKGTALGRIRAVVKVADETWIGDRLKGGLSSGEGLINEVRDPVRKRESQRENI
jgi:hypothetical protein